MATQRVVGALIARSAAIGAGATPAQASRAAVISTMFANPIAGAVIGRALAKKKGDAEPTDKPSEDKKPGGAPDGDGGPDERRALTAALEDLAEAGQAIADALEKSVANQNAVLERLTKVEQDRTGLAVTSAGSPSSPAAGSATAVGGTTKPPPVKKSP